MALDAPYERSDSDDDLYAPAAKRPRYDDSCLPPSTPPPIALASSSTSAAVGLLSPRSSSETIRGVQSRDGEETRSTSCTVDQGSEGDEGGNDDGMDPEEELPSGPDLIEDEPSVLGDTAQSGIIEQVDLYQFMCHTYITVKFRPQINFF
ncbi:BQ2448_3617 [Microbotryum intermedium]|uniref:BQ2448_3617 protein n=1 Tax=Microbotryum intermedium TaxID=269621 RepID=A0A238FCC5_9BASI|nr:BQ2448_3617 [Microbotryum intermedium]